MSSNGKSEQAENGSGCSVSDFSPVEGFKKVLLVKQGCNNGQMDLVLNSFDPETNEVQSMREELHRLQVLKSYFSLEQESEETFDRMTTMAARIFQAPIALVSLVDLGRQFFLSSKGLDVKATPRTYSFCAHVIQSTAPTVIIPDATADFRFKDNPLVTGLPHIRFYAGAPLLSPEGYKVRTLLVCFMFLVVVRRKSRLKTYFCSSERFVLLTHKCGRRVSHQISAKR
jgi:GAF domain-containing protein